MIGERGGERVFGAQDAEERVVTERVDDSPDSKEGRGCGEGNLVAKVAVDHVDVEPLSKEGKHGREEGHQKYEHISTIVEREKVLYQIDTQCNSNDGEKRLYETHSKRFCVYRDV